MFHLVYLFRFRAVHTNQNVIFIFISENCFNRFFIKNKKNKNFATPDSPERQRS